MNFRYFSISVQLKLALWSFKVYVKHDRRWTASNSSDRARASSCHTESEVIKELDCRIASNNKILT